MIERRGQVPPRAKQEQSGSSAKLIYHLFICGNLTGEPLVGVESLNSLNLSLSLSCIAQLTEEHTLKIFCWPHAFSLLCIS
jgi:hypothetical protein